MAQSEAGFTDTVMGAAQRRLPRLGLARLGLTRLGLPGGAALGVLVSQVLFSGGSFLLTLVFARIAAPQAFAAMSYLQLAAALPMAAVVSAVTLLRLDAGDRASAAAQRNGVTLALCGGAALVGTAIFAVGSGVGPLWSLAGFGALLIYMIYVTTRRHEAFERPPVRLLALDLSRVVIVGLACTGAILLVRPSLGIFMAVLVAAHAPAALDMWARRRRPGDPAPPTPARGQDGFSILWRARGLLFGLLLNSLLSQLANLAAPRLCSPSAFAALRGVEVLFLPVFTLLQAGDMAAPGWLRARSGPARVRLLAGLALTFALAPVAIGLGVLAVRASPIGRAVLNPIYTQDTGLVIGLCAVYVTIAVNGVLQWALLAEGQAEGFVGISLGSAVIGLGTLIVFRQDGVMAIVLARLAYEIVLGLAIVIMLRPAPASPRRVAGRSP